MSLPPALPVLAVSLALVAAAPVGAQTKPRARDLGVPFDGVPGRLNAITDVPGVEVGHQTIIRGEGTLVVGRGPVRTGVTAVHPRGRSSSDPVFAGFATLNGNGEMTGVHWLRESGFLWGPIVLTNTLSVGVARDAVVAWALRQGWNDFDFALPVVAETWDGDLSDIDGFHLTREDVWAALDGARAGAVAEGNVGGGTGMICHAFKCGIGTASRQLDRSQGGFTVGVLVQANYGRRDRLTIAGVPVGREIADLLPCYVGPAPHGEPPCRSAPPRNGSGSIIVVIATDAPLLPHQLERVARRAGLGVGRMGGLGEDSSGDLFVAFSTANPGAAVDSGFARLTMLPNDRINPMFEATVQATEEAIVNAMVAAETMTGVNGFQVYAIPRDRLKTALRKYGRLR
jgi:L-aminopeptidase/D-esterase-like protein